MAGLGGYFYMVARHWCMRNGGVRCMDLPSRYSGVLRVRHIIRQSLANYDPGISMSWKSGILLFPGGGRKREPLACYNPCG